jgi:UDP-4-amino-4,6-dideoxy-N-acetyl-beta-L-altrosamine N-acetyltransferase
MIKLVKLREDHLQIVLDWRVKSEISQFMFTQVEYNFDKQKTWFKKISVDNSVAYWIIEYKGKPIGVINLAAIDKSAQKCSAGYYIGEMEFRQLSAFVLPYFYNFVFKVLKFKKIYGEVLDGNYSILKIHLMHGYRFVGTLKDRLHKNGRCIDVHMVELTSDAWLKQKRYQRYNAEFEGDL